MFDLIVSIILFWTGLVYMWSFTNVGHWLSFVASVSGVRHRRPVRLSPLGCLFLCACRNKQHTKMKQKMKSFQDRFFIMLYWFVYYCCFLIECIFCILQKKHDLFTLAHKPHYVCFKKQQVQFSSRLYLSMWKSPFALHPVSQKFS